MDLKKLKNINLYSLTWRWANFLSRPYLFIGGAPKKNPLSVVGRLRLSLAIKLYCYSYNHDKKNGALFFTGKCFQSLKNFTRALEYFEKTWETDPSNLILFKEIGTTCLKMKNFDVGLRYALKEASEFSNNEESKANLALFLLKNNRMAEAEKVIKEACDINPENPYVKDIYKLIIAYKNR